jgi:hypothetical protein
MARRSRENGTATTGLRSGTFAYADALVLQPDGKIVAVGTVFSPPIIGRPATALLARFIDDVDAVFCCWRAGMPTSKDRTLDANY